MIITTIPELAEELGVHVNTARRWAREGKLPGAIKFGKRKWTVDAEQIRKAFQTPVAPSAAVTKAQ